MTATPGSAGGAPGKEAPTLLCARNLTIGYAGRPIAHGLDLDVRRGDCIALLGPNGSGKTTLLRTLLGIHPPLTGSIHYGDAPNGAVRRPVLGYVPQRDQLDTVVPLTVAEVVRMGAYQRWRPLLRLRDGGRDRIAAALDQVRARGWEARLMRELSGGERQRVLIARALMAGSNLLFLDEPTAGIDHQSAEVIYRELSDCRAAGLGIVIVSHELAGLRQVATRVLVIEGETLAEAAVATLGSSEALASRGPPPP